MGADTTPTPQPYDFDALRRSVSGGWFLTSGEGAALLEEGAALSAEVEALRTERDRLAAVIEQVRESFTDTMPPYNMELRHDGSEDRLAASYVEGYGDAYRPVHEILSAVPSDALAGVKRVAWAAGYVAGKEDQLGWDGHYDRDNPHARSGS